MSFLEVASGWVRVVTGAVLAVGAITMAVQGTSANAGVVPPPTAASAPGICPNVRAGGHSYEVSASNLSCSFADRWAYFLAGRRLQVGAQNVAISGGPSGYSCQTSAWPPLGGISPDVQISGECTEWHKLTGPPSQLGRSMLLTPSFQWVVVIPL
jgi:hypothetical protein